MPWLCRDCLQTGSPFPRVKGVCPNCGSTKVIFHNELNTLSIAHLDCDAFYASIEKKENRNLNDKPVLVGGQGERGVVMAACYVARRFGCRSAMPMFKARALCPDAVVIRPDMKKYQKIGKDIRSLMLEKTPQVEPISIDEAFLDLSGTEKLHSGFPARTLANLKNLIQEKFKITVSIGLSHNKFLSKIASGLSKPSGFLVVGRAETLKFLENLPVNKIWGVGVGLQARLNRDGFTTIGSLNSAPENFLMKRYGRIGKRLYFFSQGIDSRSVNPLENRKSISAEITFPGDISVTKTLEEHLWPLCEKVAYRAKKNNFSGKVITLKLKTSDFQIRTRRRKIFAPTQLAEKIWLTGKDLLQNEKNSDSYRLIGIGISELFPSEMADPPDLVNPDLEQLKLREQAIDRVRSRFGNNAIEKGRSFAKTSRYKTS